MRVPKAEGLHPARPSRVGGKLNRKLLSAYVGKQGNPARLGFRPKSSEQELPGQPWTGFRISEFDFSETLATRLGVSRGRSADPCAHPRPPRLPRLSVASLGMTTPESHLLIDLSGWLGETLSGTGGEGWGHGECEAHRL